VAAGGAEEAVAWPESVLKTAVLSSVMGASVELRDPLAGVR
jgi:hypothetical protein